MEGNDDDAANDSTLCDGGICRGTVDMGRGVSGVSEQLKYHSSWFLRLWYLGWTAKGPCQFFRYLRKRHDRNSPHYRTPLPAKQAGL
jgi:hypothetical protein